MEKYCIDFKEFSGNNRDFHKVEEESGICIARDSVKLAIPQ